MRKAGQTMGLMLRQAMMTNEEYSELREGERVWNRLQRPLSLVAGVFLFTLALTGAVVACNVVFPPGGGTPFCSKHPIPASGITDDSMHSYYFTEYEATQYFWLAAFVPSFLIFFVSAIYLVAGILVAYSAPETHACVKVVENNCCASRKGGVHCLAIVNLSFAIVFALMGLFLGSTILTLQTDCSPTLFLCYEMICWSFFFLYGGTFIFLRHNAAVIMSEGDFYGNRTMDIELLEGSNILPSPGAVRRLNAAFSSWTGSSVLSSDGENDDDDVHGSGLDDAWDDNFYDNVEIEKQRR
ncbi:hypothetical protein KP509_30G024500 [Ceratopteris richardii]|uniref:Transmembrane protein n=1 Tax=Ceratopteris richardii TaxID=49495 RepID=A0A8T2R0K1_CERRI|nr:hypothetical protein KP509_30G024500 [Ceratopteris richardii]